MELTHFPFRTRGESDYDPIIEYSQEEFPRLLEVYLQQVEYTSKESWQSQFDVIKTTNNTQQVHRSENWVRIGDMEFKKLDGQWKLVFIFLSVESREKLQKENNDR